MSHVIYKEVRHLHVTQKTSSIQVCKVYNAICVFTLKVMVLP